MRRLLWAAAGRDDEPGRADRGSTTTGRAQGPFPRGAHRRSPPLLNGLPQRCAPDREHLPAGLRRGGRGRGARDHREDDREAPGGDDATSRDGATGGRHPHHRRAGRGPALPPRLGADVNVRDLNGYNAIHHAASRGDNELIPVPRREGRRRHGGQPARADHGGHGQRTRTAHLPFPGDDRPLGGHGS